MPHPLVVNIRHTKDYDVYIGRGGKNAPWGNPFSHLQHANGTIKVATRDEAVDRYRAYAKDHFTQEQLASLHGKTLACWCAPARCHGEVLVELADEAFNALDKP